MAAASATFADVLRELRARAQLTQDELANMAGVSFRTVSDLERGVATTPQRQTIRLLADALRLIGPERVRFETAARGRPPPSGSAAAVTAELRSLPRDVASFTGRHRELEQLAKSVTAAGGVVDIHAIGGMAGVGKTSFAVHAAHRLAGQFPGGQIFLQLHGHTPGQRPVEPADALASLLLAAGVPAARIPPDLDARIALWRDRVADKPLLLVLDDAASSDQVQPLLPGAGGSLVLVTSRRHLSALDDATAISLDTLPPGEAATLLVRLAGRPGLSPSDPGIREITQLCGFLPLAVGMMARQLRHHPAWSAAGRAAELASARDRLGLMETENLSVAAAFDLSYADLTADQQRLFRRLGLHPGPDIDSYAAAALDAADLAPARRGLEALYDQYLLTEPTSGRYRLHDLIREHARTLADRVDPERDRDAAVARLLDYYQHTAADANFRIRFWAHPGRNPGGTWPAAAPVLTDMQQALAWARSERASLLACLDFAVGAGQNARVIALTAGLSGLLLRDGPPTEGVARHVAAVQAAQDLGDKLSQANALCDLGEARLETGDYAAVVRAHEQAISLYGELGEPFGQAHSLNHLGFALQYTGAWPAAAQAHERALSISRDLGDRLGQANALSGLANVRAMTGDAPGAVHAHEVALGLYTDLGDRQGQAFTFRLLGGLQRQAGDLPSAARALDEALTIFREIDDRSGEAGALNERGALHRVSGELARARECHQQVLELARETASPWDKAHALTGLGRCALAAGQPEEAASLLRQALVIFQRLGAAEAPRLAAELDALTGSQPGQ